jgi:photosystem II stability/assembly factor-like uncharacterized protein
MVVRPGGNKANYRIGPSALQFINETLGRASLATVQFDAGLLESQDAGVSWSAIFATGELRSVCFADRDDGWGILGSDVVHTTDGGRTWSTSLSHPPELVNGAVKLWCNGQDVVWVTFMGPVPVPSFALFRTVDRGVTLRQVAGVGGEDVQIVDAQQAVLFGDTGFEYYVQLTEDGGVTWEPRRVITRLYANYGGVSFTSAADGWAVGRANSSPSSHPVILATTDGGQTWEQQYP